MLANLWQTISPKGGHFVGSWAPVRRENRRIRSKTALIISFVIYSLELSRVSDVGASKGWLIGVVSGVGCPPPLNIGRCVVKSMIMMKVDVNDFG